VVREYARKAGIEKLRLTTSSSALERHTIYAMETTLDRLGLFILLPLLWIAITSAQGQEPPPPGRLIDLGGRRLHVNCAGTASPTVIIENGGGGFSVEWALVQPAVAEFARICTYDRAGYAWSDRGPVDDGIEQIIDDLTLLLRKARINPPYVLVGQSLGALFIRAFQRRFPEQVVGLVFVDGTHDEDVRMVVEGKREPLSLLSRDQLPRAYEEYRKSVPVLSPGPANATPFDKLPVAQREARHWAFTRVVHDLGWLPNSLAAAESWREEFTALRRERLSGNHPLGSLPLRVLERTKDTTEAWHNQQLQLAGLSSAGKLVKAEGSGHMIHIERPDLVVQAIGEVIRDARRSK
jgi:pimeloyl-ACP methyl ester carboxylesterase